MLHELKLNEKYCEAVYWGYKNFEIRKNDRDYKVGDFVRFTAVSFDGKPIKHKVNFCYYQIVYVLSDFCGLAENYVALGIRPHRCYFGGCYNFDKEGIKGCFDCAGAKIEKQQGS